jgi:hypothetical protein
MAGPWTAPVPAPTLDARRRHCDWVLGEIARRRHAPQAQGRERENPEILLSDLHNQCYDDSFSQNRQEGGRLSEAGMVDERASALAREFTGQGLGYGEIASREGLDGRARAPDRRAASGGETAALAEASADRRLKKKTGPGVSASL